MATLSGVRVNVFNENFLNDSEQDANTVLTELDKGLRSPKIGVQCEAIVRFPRLFEKYPFPILINSSFLKLAEFFWNGSNLVRFWVLRVCQQSENHLDKIINIDAFVKRIFMVSYSNDPIARALTMRVLGAVSRVIPEKEQVHHSIRRALGSQNTIEVMAAIYASEQFAAQSRSFAISMCAKISDMILSLGVPLPMKLKLIPVLRHMHHDANTASLVCELCTNLLPKYPAASFAIAILDTLTELSARTLTAVPKQVSLLLQFLQDERGAVRGQALKSLTVLADPQCVHAWPKTAIAKFTQAAQACDNFRDQGAFLKIVRKLCNCPLTCHRLLHQQQPAMLELCGNCMTAADPPSTSSEAMSILAALVAYCRGDERLVGNIVEAVNLQIEGLLFFTARDATLTRDLRKTLAAGVQIASVNIKFGTEFAYMLVDMVCGDVRNDIKWPADDDTDITDANEELSELVPLTKDVDEWPAANAELLCDALAAVSSHFQVKKFSAQPKDENAMEVDEEPVEQTNPVSKRLFLIMDKLNKIMNEKPRPNQIHSIEILWATVLQTMIGCFVPLEIVECLERTVEATNSWTQYRIARSASRYGQHFLAARLFKKIAGNTVIDKMHFFIVGLVQMSQAECVLNYGVEYDYMSENYRQCEPSLIAAGKSTVQRMPLIKRFELAINLYWQAVASLRASSSPSNPMTFQLDYLKLRVQLLQVLHFAVTLKTAHIIITPPAIAGSLAQSSRDYLNKFGHITHRLRKLLYSLKECAEAYERLYKSAFDADPVTLDFLEIMEYQCSYLSYVIESICYASPNEKPNYVSISQHPETLFTVMCCRRLEELEKHLPNDTPNSKTIGHIHLEVIMAQIELLTKTPHCIPRYFFQTLQSTQIKLSISPQPRTQGEPVLVQSGSNLVIKVEGVIQHYGKTRSQFRRVDSVELILTSQLVAQRPSSETAKAPSDAVTLKQTVKPQRDFLSASFLLPISSGGQWTVSMETYVVDESGITWSTGPKNSMVVRVLDDPTKAPASSTQSGSSRRF